METLENTKLDQDALPLRRGSLLEISWATLLTLASLCSVMACVVVVQIALSRPVPKSAMALRALVIPEAAPGSISDGFQYRHFLSQIVHRGGRNNFFEGRDLSDLIIRVSLEENIDPLFVAAIIKAESTFHIGAVSNRGARGLMQIRSGTGEYVASMIDQPWQGERFLHDPEYNLRLGISYLKYLSRKFDGNLEHVLAAYNWGPGNVKKTGGAHARLPDVTKKYVGVIMGNHKKWKAELKQVHAANLAIQQSIQGVV